MIGADGVGAMLERLREEVYEANLEIVRRGLVLYTFGNVSGIDRSQGLVVIKPSGVDYDRLTAGEMVVTDLDGRVRAGNLRPSVDLATHLALYQAFADIGGVVHTHSEFATIFAQAKRPVPALGTTHADYFHGPIPVTRDLTSAEIDGDYVASTGRVIAETFEGRDPMAVPAALVASHGPFAWGRSPADAVHNAVVLEAVAKMALHTLTLSPDAGPMQPALLDQHFLRKHGSAATYGQGDDY
jgi:L-ribulose-5-phosphate 4-epimerase